MGRLTIYTRDSRHRIIQIDYYDNSYETFTYNNLVQFTQLLNHRRRNGGLEYSLYNTRGLQTSFQNAEGKITNFTYDAADRLKTVTDARGNTIEYEYNERGLLTKMINPGGSVKKYGYDSFGNQDTITNELGKQWITKHDEFRRPKTVTDPKNRITTYSYDLPGGGCGCSHSENNPTKIISPSGKILEIKYDVEWRTIQEIVGAGTAEAASTFYEYDAVGNLITVTDSKGKKRKYIYDERNRKKSEIDPLGNKMEWISDAAGRRKTFTRPDNGISKRSYDDINNIVLTTDRKNQVTKTTFDPEGNISKITDPKNNEYQFIYDKLNRLKRTIYPGNTFEEYIYDPVGNRITYTNRSGKIRTQTFDSRNRLKSTAWNDNLTPPVTYEYDDANRVTKMSSSISILSYDFNEANDLENESQSIAGMGAKKVEYTYNNDGLRGTLKYPSGTIVSYGYSARNQLALIEENGQKLASFSYDLHGNRSIKELGRSLTDKTVTKYIYDDENRLLSIDNQMACFTTARFDYGYDNVGRQKFVQRDNNKGDVYLYDAIDQVDNVKYDVTNPGGNPGLPVRTVTYQWDASGNRTSMIDNGITTDYLTNNLNQYTKVGNIQPSFTTNGNLETWDGWKYTYDAQDRLIKAEKGSTVVEFAYDPRNRCVKRTINGSTIYFYFDHSQLIDERSASDAQLAQYINGARTDEILQKASGSGTFFYHHDALGNVTHLTNSLGNLVESYLYDVFGTPIIKGANGTIIATSNVGNRFLFTGREFIHELNLYDYRNRMYQNAAGRFLQPDPIGFASNDYNLYRYVYNRPISLTDPFGLFTCRPIKVGGKDYFVRLAGREDIGFSEYEYSFLMKAEVGDEYVYLFTTASAYEDDVKYDDFEGFAFAQALVVFKCDDDRNIYSSEMSGEEVPNGKVKATAKLSISEVPAKSVTTTWMNEGEFNANESFSISIAPVIVLPGGAGGSLGGVTFADTSTPKNPKKYGQALHKCKCIE
ncbi:MAG: RHS repeat-associated core domain-containing protein [Chitinophagaceae bacterium]